MLNAFWASPIEDVMRKRRRSGSKYGIVGQVTGVPSRAKVESSQLRKSRTTAPTSVGTPKIVEKSDRAAAGGVFTAAEYVMNAAPSATQPRAQAAPCDMLRPRARRLRPRGRSRR